MNGHADGEEISAFLDRALDAESRARVSAHLAACAACAAELESARELKSALAALPRKTMPAGLALSLERRFANSGGASWKAWLKRPVVWAPAGALAAAALALGVWLSGRPVEEVPLEPLLAVHVRGGAQGLLPQDNAVASTYSDQLSAPYADSSDPGLE